MYICDLVRQKSFKLPRNCKCLFFSLFLHSQPRMGLVPWRCPHEGQVVCQLSAPWTTVQRCPSVSPSVRIQVPALRWHGCKIDLRTKSDAHIVLGFTQAPVFFFTVEFKGYKLKNKKRCNMKKNNIWYLFTIILRL